MSELRRDGRELLSEARRERTPDAATRERVFDALLANEALANASGAAPEAEPQVLTGLGKWLLLLVLVVAVALAVYVAGHTGSKPLPALR